MLDRQLRATANLQTTAYYTAAVPIQNAYQVPHLRPHNLFAVQRAVWQNSAQLPGPPTSQCALYHVNRHQTAGPECQRAAGELDAEIQYVPALTL